MISLHRLNGQELVLNAELIESLEPHHNATVVHLATGNRVVVREAEPEVVQRVLDYRRRAYRDAPARPAGGPALPELLKGAPRAPEEV